MAGALIRAGRDFDLLTVPGNGVGHLQPLIGYIQRRRFDCFVSHRTETPGRALKRAGHLNTAADQGPPRNGRPFAFPALAGAWFKAMPGLPITQSNLRIATPPGTAVGGESA